MRVVRKRLHMQIVAIAAAMVAMVETVFGDIVNCKGKGTSRVLYEPEDEPVKRYN